MDRIKTAALGLACLAGFAVFACDDDITPPQPVPGDLVVALVSPNGAEGAVVLETTDEGIVDVALVAVTALPGGGVAVQPAAGGAFHERSGDTSRIVVYLDEPGAISLSITVEDVNAPPALAVVEVADGENRLRGSLSGYEVEIVGVDPGGEGA